MPGAPVVFLHPAAASSAGWLYQVPTFSAAGFRCITYDLRGWGRSRPTSSANPGTMSDDLATLIRHLGLDRPMLIGAAYGAFGALDYALRFPDAVRALVLSTTWGGIVDPGYAAMRKRLAAPGDPGAPDRAARARPLLPRRGP